MLSTIRRSAGRRGAVRPAALLMSVLALAACDDDDDPFDPGPDTEWAAEIAGTGDYADITGAIAVGSDDDQYVAVIAIEGAEPDAVFAWALQEGTCAEPGDVLGTAAFADLEADGDGEATAEADDDVSLDEEGDYIVTITDESGDEDVSVACEELVLVDD